MFSVVIPAKNEEKHIGRLIDSIERVVKKNKINLEIIAVNDGSTDGTESVIKRKVKEYKNVRMVSYKKNRGKTYACFRGVRASRGKWVIFMDADLQHDPRDIPKFIKSAKGAELIIGERDVSKMPLARRISNLIAASVINLFTGRNFDDVLCGYRAVRRDKFFELDIKSGRYEIEIDMLLNAMKLGMKIKRIRVRTIYERKGKKIGSRMPILSAVKLSWNMTKKLWWFWCTNR